MITKLPACYDVSHWKEIKNFKLVKPRPVLFITKATEAAPNTGYNHTDEKFIRFAVGMREIGCTRGFYHFNRKSVDPRRQAEHFINVISRIDVLPTDILILDIEEGGEKASQLWAWHEVVRSAFPDNMRMNYSRKNILDPIAMFMPRLVRSKSILNDIQMTLAEREYFKLIPTWTAGYPYFPDLFSKVPSGYVPDQNKFGKVYLWQYSEKGIVEGIEGSVDMNWVSPELYAIIGDSVDVGELVMANQIWEVTSSTPAKVWKSIGGERVYPDLVKGTRVTISGIQGDYLVFLNGNVSKKEWFKYIQDVTPEPPPPPPPPPSEEYILHVKDGVTRKFILSNE